MAKKKSAPKDQHKSGFMVRLPESARAMLNEMKQDTRRAYTMELLVALEAHYAAWKAGRRAGAKSA